MIIKVKKEIEQNLRKIFDFEEAGPWDNEVKSDEYLVDEYKGYKFYVTRNPFMGTLNGYVEVPKKYFSNEERECLEKTLDCHGGITWYSDSLPWQKKEAPPQSEFYGFDCGHAGDLIPSLKHLSEDRNKLDRAMFKEYLGDDAPEGLLDIFERNGDIFSSADEYRTQEFVIEQCKHLIDQVAEEKGN